jgi:hypothetical protein
MTTTSSNTECNTTSNEMTSSCRKSALQDNIERKGKNAYYFAHSHKANGPEWDGKVEPKLLARMSTSSLNDTNNRNSNNTTCDGHFINIDVSKPSSFDYSKSTITSYAFLDDGKKVKLYIDMENVGEQCTNDDIALDYTERTLSFTLRNYKPLNTIIASSTTSNENNDNDTTTPTSVQPQTLRFGKLSNDISHASFRIKKDKIIITLTKVDPDKVWHTINDKGTPDHEIV